MTGTADVVGEITWEVAGVEGEMTGAADVVGDTSWEVAGVEVAGGAAVDGEDACDCD